MIWNLAAWMGLLGGAVFLGGQQPGTAADSCPVRITSVTSDKATYRPGETAEISVALENRGAKAVRARLLVEAVEGLDNRTRLFDGEVLVGPGAESTRSDRYAVGTALWGRGIEVRLEAPEGAALGRHAFSVVTDPFMAAMFGRGLPSFGSERLTPEQAEQEARRIAKANRAAYSNAYEAFAWAPCDFSRMTVGDDQPFHSGQTQYCRRRSVLQTLHRVFHQQGIFCITYGKSCAAGLPGVEYALGHPEQMNVFPPAGFAHEAISVDILDRMLEHRYRRHGRDEDFWQSWISSWTLLGSLDAANFGCDEIARSAKMFDWDGVRYDGHFSVWRNPAMAARMVRHCAGRLQSERPGFACGYNFCGPRHGTAEGAFSDVEMAACARGGGLVMSEYYRNLLGPVKNNIEHLRWAGDAVRLHGGYFLVIFDEKSEWSAALAMAGGARPMGGDGRLRMLATRLSAFVLDPAMRRLQDPGKILRPGRNADFRWDAFVFEKPVSATESLLIVQLVNVTDQFAFHGANRPLTGASEPRSDVELQLALPAGYQAAGIYAWDDALGYSAMRAVLGGDRITVPRLRAWTVAVVRLKRAAEAPSLAALCELPLKGLSQDSGRRTSEPAASDSSGIGSKPGAAAGGDLVSAVNADQVKITPAVLDAVLAAGPPEDYNPGAKAYATPDFSGHRSGVDAAYEEGDSPVFADAKTGTVPKGAKRGTVPKRGPPLVLRRNGRLDVLSVRGVFSHLDRLEEALAEVPRAVVQDAYLSQGRVACRAKLEANTSDCLTGWPSRDELADFDLVVLDDIPAPAFTLSERRDLLDFVQSGGSLLVLGGWYSLSKGAWEGSFLEEALPVETLQAPHLLRLGAEDQRLGVTPDFAEVPGAAVPDFGPRGSAEWINHIRPRSAAKVLVTAGAKPVLVAGGCGQGRVFVWAGSHSGRPETPYWQSAAWPKLLGAVVRKLAAGAEVISPADPALAAQLAQAKQAMADESFDVILGEAKPPRGAKADAQRLARLKFLLSAGGEAEALTVATYLLDHPDRVDPREYDELTEAIAPRIGDSAAWAALGERHAENPPLMLHDLVAEIVAAAVKSVRYAAIQKWRLQDPVTRLRCIAACGDPAATGPLDAELRQLAEQESRWAALVASDNYTTDTVKDTYRTRLLRPFVAYALLRCGKRDEATLYEFCRGVLDLPYYAWRQRWIVDGARGNVAAASRLDNPAQASQAKAQLRHVEMAVRQLDRAVACLAPMFRPEVVGTDEVGCRAAARALGESDCRKALPLARAFLQAFPPDPLGRLGSLEQAKLASIRQIYAALTSAAAGQGAPPRGR